MEKDDNKDINLRSEEVQELMGEVPPLILRMGITLLFAVVIMTIVLSAVIKYPEQIDLQGALMNTNISFKGDSCEVTYICPIGLRSKERLKIGMPASVTIGGDVMLVGRIVDIDSLYNESTGLFNIQVHASAKKRDFPLLIQYKGEATIKVDMSNQTVLKRILSRN